MARSLISPVVSQRSSARLPERARSLATDPINVVLCAVFLLASAFYLWLAADTIPLSLHGSQASPYNQLADAFLHLHLWVARAPAALLRLPEPYNPDQHVSFISTFPDYALYGHYLYLTWGPAPAVMLLVPMHLLGFEPSGSVILTPFAIAGLGFALATLRVLLRQIGNVRLWMCALAALTLALCSVVPYDAGLSSVYYEAVAAGYCFTMAGVWLAMSALADRRASLTRLSLMSLCFGLAAGSRPSLGFAALMLAPVYMSLRSTQRRRALLVALAVPVGVCVLLLAAYDQARFGSILQYGTRYQLSGEFEYRDHYGALSYVPPGVWSYLITPPRLSILFPFIVFIAPRISYPFALPTHYLANPEVTGGLVPLAPVVIFLFALPWIWRRRPALLGPLAFPLLVLASVGLAILLFLSYEFFSTNERYEVDFTSFFLFGALAAWLTLSAHAQGRRRRLIQIGGALLAVWGCLAGVAIAYSEIGERHVNTWHQLVNLSSPLSTAMALLAGHPVLAAVESPNVAKSHESYADLGSDVTGFWLDAHQQADLTIVSPNARYAVVVANMFAGPALGAGASLEVRIRGPGDTSHRYPLRRGRAETRIPVRVSSGVNRFSLSPVASAINPSSLSSPGSRPLLGVTHLRLGGS